MLDLKLIRYAQVLATHRNFRRAAESLGLSQPALSRAISGLESDLGVRLFDRTRHGVEPTQFGARYLSRGGELLRDAAELEREFEQIQLGVSGVLRVGAGPYPADICVGPALGRLNASHPRVRVELSTGDWRGIVGQLLRADLDVAVVELSAMQQDPRLVVEPLPHHAGAFFCRPGHPLLDANPLSLERLLEYPLAGPKLPPRIGSVFHRLAKSWAIDPANGDYLPSVKVDTTAVAKAVVVSSDVIGVAPLRLLASDAQAGLISVLPFRESWLRTSYGFVHLRERALSLACRAFMSEVRAIERAMSEPHGQAAAD